jgi:hypothetical protein
VHFAPCLDALGKLLISGYHDGRGIKRQSILTSTPNAPLMGRDHDVPWFNVYRQKFSSGDFWLDVLAGHARWGRPG